MFLHLGNNCMIRKDKIITILDLNTAGSNENARSLLDNILKRGEVHNISEKGKEKAFVISDSGNYLSPISSTTLLKRSQSDLDIESL
ncbi:MAG: hypothetical protein APF84_04375 [Gracilibacter sp. BRH_c7a]|nr:MAG: hypothetical protein APF84_04375 [Gracilibacter sp. BRH_c7a]